MTPPSCCLCPFPLRNLFFRELLPFYVPLHPIRFSSPSTPAQNRSHGSNVVCNGSPSRIRIVRRISLGITTRPRSSMRRTIPVAFILDSSRICRAGARRVYCIALENMDSIRRSWEGMQIFGWICFPARGRNFHQNRPSKKLRSHFFDMQTPLRSSEDAFG